MGWAGLVLLFLSCRHAVQTNKGPFQLSKNAAAALDHRARPGPDQVLKSALARSIRLASASWSWDLGLSYQHVVVRWRVENAKVLPSLPLAEKAPDTKARKKNRRIKETNKEERKIQEVYHIPHTSRLRYRTTQLKSESRGSGRLLVARVIYHKLPRYHRRGLVS